MSENIRALIVIFALSISFFWLAKKQVCYLAMEEVDFNRRRNVWLAVVAVYFLSGNFWLFMFFASILILMAGSRDVSRFSLYLMIFYAVPLVSVEIPGFGILNYLMAIDYNKLLALLLLLPCWIQLSKDPEAPALGSTFADKCALGYIILPLILQGLEDTLTNTLRQGFYSFIELFLPYYVSSRALRNIQAFRDVMLSFTIGILLLSPIGLFEYLRKWLLYSNVPSSMGVPVGASYLGRGNDLRAMASSGHALVMGYLMVIASGLYVYSRRLLPNKKFVLLGLGALLVGLWVPISRGPWLGALLVLAVIYATGPSPVARTIKLILICLPIGISVLLSPLGEKILPLIPFIGEIAPVSAVDQFNAVYRQRLLTISLQVIETYPFFGSFHFRDLPIMQSLIQGEGIIDIVNAYLAVALTYGLVGLALYLGMFLAALRSVWVGYRSCPVGDELHTLGRALLAALLGVMFTIMGVSNSFTIVTINMVLIGLCLSYGDLVARYHLGRVAAGQGPARAYRPGST